MFRHGEHSTEVDRGPFFFTLIALIVSTVGAVLLFVLGRGNGLSIFAGIMVAIIALAAAAVFFSLLTDQAYIENDVLHMHYLFKKRSIPIAEIGRITFTDGVYSVFDRKNELAGTINARLTGIDSVIHSLDQHGVNFR